MELNTINKTGTWSDAADRINNNFSKISTEVDKLKLSSIRNKGLFPTLDALKSAIPSPVVGDWAVVGNSIPGSIYQCRTKGIWSATGQTGGGGEVDLTDYYTKGEVDPTISELKFNLVKNRAEILSVGRFDGKYDGVVYRNKDASASSDNIPYYLEKGKQYIIGRSFNASGATSTIKVTYEDGAEGVVAIQDEERIIKPSKNGISIKFTMYNYQSDEVSEMYYYIKPVEDIRGEIGKLKYGSIINISLLFPTGGFSKSDIYDLSSAIKLVPEEYRVVGILITFKDVIGYWQTWQYTNKIYEYETLTSWSMVEYTGKEVSQASDIYQRKKAIEKVLTSLYNNGMLVKDVPLVGKGDINNKYLLQSTGVSNDNEGYYIRVYDVTGIDMFYIEGVNIGNVSNYAFSTTDKINDIVEVSSSDRGNPDTYSNGIIIKPYPAIRYMMISVRKDPLEYARVYKVKILENYNSDNFQQKSKTLKQIDAASLVKGFGNYNVSLQNIINQIGVVKSDILEPYKIIDNYYFLVNEYVNKLSYNENYVTKVYDVKDLDHVYIKAGNIRNVTPYGWINDDITEEEYGDLIDYIVYSPDYLTIDRQYDGIVIKPIGAKYLIVTEKKNTPVTFVNKCFVSAKNKLTGKTFWTVFDSLGAGNQWQNKFAELSNMIFYPELNNTNNSPISFGGTSSSPSGDDGGQARLINLNKLKNKYPIDYIFYENINDVRYLGGSIDDKPFMRSEKIIILKDGEKFSSNSEASVYFSNNKSKILNSVNASQRKSGVILSMPFENASVNAGYTIKFISVPTSSGTAYVVKGGNRYGIDVTPQMSIQDLVNAVLNYSYGAGWGDSATGDDSVSIYYFQENDTVISFDSNGTGIQTEISRCGTIGASFRFFTGYTSSEWFDDDKWVSSISIYSAYKGIIEYVKKNFPNAFFYWFIPTRYSVPLDGTASYVKSDGSFDNDKYRQTDDFKTYRALVDCQKEVCKLYDVPVVDIEENCNINLFNLGLYYSSNNVHPKIEGYERWAETLFNLLG